MKFIIEDRVRSRVRYVILIVMEAMNVMIAVCIETRGFFAL